MNRREFIASTGAATAALTSGFAPAPAEAAQARPALMKVSADVAPEDARLKAIARYGIKNIVSHPIIADGRLYATVDELKAMRASGLLSRLTLAWSRDSEQKIYVQHRMREVGRDLWAWIADGAHVYVCGDAKHMANDVERALVDVVATFDARTPDQAIAFVSDLKKAGRYQTDVY